MSLTTIINKITGGNAGAGRLAAAVLLSLLALAGAPRLRAQFAEPMLSHYYEVPSFYNPAALGLTDRIRIRAGARLQWVGIDRAPVSVVAAADMPFKLGRRRLGVGLALQQESYGLWRNMTLGAQVSYAVKLFGGTLRPGLRIGILNQSFRGSEVYLPDDDEFHQGTDDAIPTRDVGGNALDLGAGVYYDRRSWWAGVSLLHANAPTVKFDAEGAGSPTTRADGDNPGDNPGDATPDSPGTEGVKNYEFPVGRSLYFMAGGNIPVRNTLFELMPSVIAAYDLGNELTGVATALVRYNRMVSAGLSYRYRDGVALHLGLELKNFYVGYTYEYPLSAVSRASSGSHEIMAGYSLKLDLGDKNRHRQKSVRIL